MLLETRIAIKNNPYYYQFLRYNSSWYKALKRSHSNLELMDKEVKDYFKLNLSDKLNDLSSRLGMVSTLIDLMK